MKPLVWNEEKNNSLKATRGISFDEVAELLETSHLLSVRVHPNPTRYPKQKLYIISYKEDIIIVPFVEEVGYIFLKTIYKSRKYRKQFIKKKGKKL